MGLRHESTSTGTLRPHVRSVEGELAPPPRRSSEWDELVRLLSALVICVTAAAVSAMIVSTVQQEEPAMRRRAPRAFAGTHETFAPYGGSGSARAAPPRRVRVVRPKKTEAPAEAAAAPEPMTDLEQKTLLQPPRELLE